MSTHSRTHPSIAQIVERYLLTGASSTKRTYHVALQVEAHALPFVVGDSVGVIPENQPELVEAVLRAARVDGATVVLDARLGEHLSLHEFLLRKANLAKCTTALLRRVSAEAAPELAKSHELLDLLRMFPDAALSAQELASALLPLMPRFYSIASSAHMFPGEIHLTVAELTYKVDHELRWGVGSHYVCHRATSLPVYVQPSNGFTIPADGAAPIILIGPGTGVAPFRAFLQERMALGHTGPNWLFFGERNRATDFYYRDYWLELERQGRLRLDVAFSRDSAEKTYVQHKLWEGRADVWRQLQEGAFLYVCGDAEKMAKDVEATLLRIAAEHMSDDKAREWLKSLRKNRHYLTDVY